MTSKGAASSEDTNGGKSEYLFKVLVIGELATGKTAVVKRYMHNFFSEHYRSTIGVDFALKVIPYNDDTTIRLQLWDIAGQERFGNMTRVYYKDAVGCLIVFDITRESTFDAVMRWKSDLDSKVQLPNGDRIPCVLLANKCDLVRDDLADNAQQMNDYCQEKGFIKWFETSAKDNINIENSIKFLIDEIMKHIEVIQSANASKEDIVNPEDQGPPSTGSKSCCGGKS
ncbi:unnamed protein product [Adineta ricciae]|uniref:Ras-related protein Rab n=1 Tax=Adineta ricciae TaxID=249248 RepID=A0A814SLB8_ADIRI|nr:unnamed protein product [Adineta ricciae]CAF1148913.1 unnamed protein product [Adineta ricciae]